MGAGLRDAITDRFGEEGTVVFGFQMNLPFIMYGGVLVFALLVFELLVGLRIIKFKGRTHLKVHKWAAYVLVALTALHGLLAIILYNNWRIF
jgi:hypothetical protein